MHLARRPCEQKSNWSFYLSQVLSFPYIIQTDLFPSLLLVQVNMTSSTEQPLKTLGKRYCEALIPTGLCILNPSCIHFHSP
jgi:hypothetical protein